MVSVMTGGWCGLPTGGLSPLSVGVDGHPEQASNRKGLGQAEQRRLDGGSYPEYGHRPHSIPDPEMAGGARGYRSKDKGIKTSNSSTIFPLVVRVPRVAVDVARSSPGWQCYRRGTGTLAPMWDRQGLTVP